jgi:DNA polymerase-1
MCPGVPGIGPKTATQLIQQYGDLETVLASTDEITKPKAEAESDRAMRRMRGCSRKLVELVCEAPSPSRSRILALKGIPPEPLKSSSRTGLQVAAQPGRQGARSLEWRRPAD